MWKGSGLGRNEAQLQRSLEAEERRGETERSLGG